MEVVKDTDRTLESSRKALKEMSQEELEKFVQEEMRNKKKKQNLLAKEKQGGTGLTKPNQNSISKNTSSDKLAGKKKEKDQVGNRDRTEKKSGDFTTG